MCKYMSILEAVLLLFEVSDFLKFRFRSKFVAKRSYHALIFDFENNLFCGKEASAVARLELKYRKINTVKIDISIQINIRTAS